MRLSPQTDKELYRHTHIQTHTHTHDLLNYKQQNSISRLHLWISYWQQVPRLHRHGLYTRGV